MTKADITWLTSNLATGADLSPDVDEAVDQVFDILDQGITTVLDLRAEAGDHLIWDSVEEVDYVHLPVHDFGQAIPGQFFDQVVVHASEALAAGSKVLVHCHMGINRGPSGAFAVLLDQGMDPLVAFDLIRSKRPIAGISYAMDALRADHSRRAVMGHQPRDMDVKRLERHIKAVMTPDVQAGITRAIRKGHEDDNERWRRVAAEISAMR